MNEVYRQQAKLLLDVLPEVARESCFALHGGTAINLFVLNLPRLSVDIDLTYLEVAERNESLTAINAASQRLLTLWLMGQGAQHRVPIELMVRKCRLKTHSEMAEGNEITPEKLVRMALTSYQDFPFCVCSERPYMFQLQSLGKPSQTRHYRMAR